MDADGAALSARRGRPWRSTGTVLLVAAPAAFLAAFYAWPLAEILVRSLAPGDAADGTGPRAALGDPLLWRTAWFTTWQAALSTVCTLVVGLPVAAAVARYRFRGRALVATATTTAFVLPTVVVGAAFATVLPRGVPAIIVAHVFFNLAIVVRVVGTAWAQLDENVADAARCLGAGPVRVFRTVTLPLLRPAIAAAASLVFLFTFTSFGVVLVLGGPTVNTLETGVWRLTTQQFRLDTAAVWAVVQIAAALAILAAIGSGGRAGGDIGTGTAVGRLRPPSALAAKLLVAVAAVIVVTVLALPVVELVRRSLQGSTGISLSGWRSLLPGVADTDGGARFTGPAAVAPWRAIGTSLWIATVATLLATGLGLAAATTIAGVRGGRWSALFSTTTVLPLATSSVAVGFGMLLAYSTAPVDLLGSPLLLPAAHAVVALPFVVRVLVPALRGVDPVLRDAAATLGASPWRVWRTVDVVVAGRAVAVAAGFAACISLGEFGATAFLVRPDTVTVPVAIFRLLGRPGALNQSTAAALAVVLLVITAAITLAVDRLRPASLRRPSGRLPVDAAATGGRSS